MFKTKDVSCLLQDLKFTGDGDDALAHARFYVTPIKHSLALEISPKLADRLFRRRAAEHVPAAEIPTIGFDIDVGAQSITYAVHPVGAYTGEEVEPLDPEAEEETMRERVERTMAEAAKPEGKARRKKAARSKK